MSSTFYSALKWFGSVVLGTIWCWIEPTLPFALICLFATILDCITAWRLNGRVAKAYPNSKADGKFKSVHAFKMVGDLFIVFGCIVLAFHVDKTLFPYQSFYLGQLVAAIFVFVEFWSVLENESSCSDKNWARLMQKFVVDKTERHLDIDLHEYKHNDGCEANPATPEKPVHEVNEDEFIYPEKPKNKRVRRKKVVVNEE